MKKMRLLAFLVTACLATTCFLSGTVAKYSTTGAVEDAARVAKWGVTIEADSTNNTLFNSSYSNTSNVVTVQTTDNDTNVVAPGTEDSVTMKLSGSPEVRVKVTLKVEGNDITLPKDYAIDDTTKLSEAYKPVVFTLSRIDTAKTDDNEKTIVIKEGTLADIKAYLEDTKSDTEGNQPWSEEYEVNKNLGEVTYTLSWKWDFSSEGDINDKYDTILGNEAAKAEDARTQDVVVSTGNVTLTVIAEQVD